MDLIKIEKFAYQKKDLKSENQATEQEKIFSKHISDKGLYEEYLQPKKERENNTIKTWKKGLN